MERNPIPQLDPARAQDRFIARLNAAEVVKDPEIRNFANVLSDVRYAREIRQCESYQARQHVAI